MNKLGLVLSATPALLILSASAFSFTDGTIPGKVASTLPGMPSVPIDVVRQAPGCGHCHPTTAASTAIVDVVPAQRTLDPNQSISMTTSVTGGLMVSGKENWGGFVTEATRGTFTATATTETSTDNKFISHKFSFVGRSWPYTYNAPGTPGLVELYAAANTVNGDGTEQGDMWSFRGDTTGQQSTPVRMFVNAPGVTHHGDGCVGSFNNHPVLGAKETATVGSNTFSFEVHGAAASAPIALMLGIDPAFQIPLDIIGVTGCTLHLNPLITVAGLSTSAGSTQRGEGTAVIPMPIANEASWAGLTWQAQVLIVDAATGRQTPLTLTNALSFTIQ